MIFNEDLPIYLQITEWVYDKILKGEWVEESRIPSVRELGLKLAVNPHTVLKAYDKLQAGDIIYNRRGIGYFLASGAKNEIMQERKAHFLNEELPIIYKKMKVLNIPIEDIIRKIEQLKNTENENI